ELALHDHIVVDDGDDPGQALVANSVGDLAQRPPLCRIVLRFDAVTHYGKVWVNNQEVMEHQGGYTPFEADVTPYVIAGKSVRITVCVNNELNWQTIPPGMVITDENGKKKQS
ncbi:sugar-binding domain-containing protein, partial [Pseudomonas aeruginosa]|uniref:sugar-binding domain-containing protein n=1 Tax=Pseudomonas aeruginosa TaxID=287 RepID=UPI0031B6DDA5